MGGVWDETGHSFTASAVQLGMSGTPIALDLQRMQRALISNGSGSLSFELIRDLVERLPVMACPKWVATPAQPIAIEDVLDYLLAARDMSDNESRTFEIGGPDQVCYGDIMREYARQRGLTRVMIPVPVLTSPRHSAPRRSRRQQTGDFLVVGISGQLPAKAAIRAQPCAHVR